jgi:mannitol 2-dehydrogenase
VVASWARYAEAVDEQGQPIEVVDRLRDKLVERAQHNREDPLVFISDPDLFGDLASDEQFVTQYKDALQSLHEIGARATLEAL